MLKEAITVAAFLLGGEIKINAIFLKSCLSSNWDTMTSVSAKLNEDQFT